MGYVDLNKQVLITEFLKPYLLIKTLRNGLKNKSFLEIYVN